MAVITLGQICNAIAVSLATVPQLLRVQTYTQITEAVHPGDAPCARVYMTAGRCDWQDDTDRATFQAGVRVKQFELVVDVPCQQRIEIAEDLTATIDTANAVEDMLETLQPPFFGVTGVNALRWEWELFIYEQLGEVDMVGFQLRITVWVF